MEIPHQKLLGNLLGVAALSDFQGSTIRDDVIKEEVLLNHKHGCFKTNAEKWSIVLHFSFLCPNISFLESYIQL